MSNLTGKVAVVTGGSRGIGFAVARALLERGAAVVIAGVDQAVLAEALQRLRAAGIGTVVGLQADVRRYDEVERLMRAAVDECGGIDILVNNAGVGRFGPVATMPLDEWSRVIDTNLTGAFHGCRAVLPHLEARGGGWIVNISSLAGRDPFANGAAYCASKAALTAFSDALMLEVRQRGIRVACVLPGSVDTGFMGRAASSHADTSWKLAPEDVAEVVTDLLAHPSRSLPSRVEIRPSRPPVKG